MKTIKIGSQYEKEVEERLQRRGYKTHRNPKSRFGTQDILGIADIVATKRDSFVLVACAVGRRQTETHRKIEAIRPYIPKSVKILYYIKKENGERILKY